MDKIEERTTRLIQRAEEDALHDFQKVYAEHSAKGVLASGATIKKCIAAYAERMSTAIDQVLAEVAKAIENRGREWNSAMDAVRRALELAEARTPEILAKPLKFAGGSGAAEKAALARIAVEFLKLRQQIEEFSEGWTAPPPKPWHERNAVIYTALGAIGGAILTKVVDALAG